MGGKRESSSNAKCPAGVEIRHWKNGTTSLRIIFRYRGVRCREGLKLPATANNIKYAANLRSEILSTIARGTFNYLDYFPDSLNAKKFGYKQPSNITIGTMLEDYLKQAERTLEYSTYIGYRKKTERYLFPNFRNLPIRELTPAMIREWVKDIKLTMKTVRNIIIPLRAVIETALVDEIIDKNPLDNIILNKLIDKETSKSDYEVDPFDRKEIAAILNTAEGQVKNLFQFAFFTGLRPSELIALEWNDIDWINGQAHISRAIVYGRVKKPKTKAGIRNVLLLPPALEALKAQKPFTFMKSKYVFHTPFSDKPWSAPFQIRHEAWVPILRKAGVRYRNPYQMRHTYASMMLSNGENIMWVAKQMGHVNIEMVMRIYGKWLPDNSIATGYKPVNDWSKHVELTKTNGPVVAPQSFKNDLALPRKEGHFNRT